jgi:hypothetical protein
MRRHQTTRTTFRPKVGLGRGACKSFRQDRSVACPGAGALRRRPCPAGDGGAGGRCRCLAGLCSIADAIWWRRARLKSRRYTAPERRDRVDRRPHHVARRTIRGARRSGRGPVMTCATLTAPVNVRYMVGSSDAKTSSRRRPVSRSSFGALDRSSPRVRRRCKWSSELVLAHVSATAGGAARRAIR